MAQGRYQFFHVDAGLRAAAMGSVSVGRWRPPQARVRWRLMAGNNHELGRSPGSFPDAESAAAAVARLRSRLEETTDRLSFVDHDGTWRWQLQLGPYDVVAESPRPYHRKIECRMAVQQFVVLAATAVVPDVVRTLRADGTTRRQAHAEDPGR